MIPVETGRDSKDRAAFLARLREFEGRETGPPFIGRDPVNAPMIHHWCDAIGDDLPVYADADLATQSVHGGIVAPPTMLQVWAMAGLRPAQASLETELRKLLGILADAGFLAVIATNYDQEYTRYVKPGECLSETTVIESISEEKTTGLGVGHFVTTRSTYRDEQEHAVGTSGMRILVYNPKPRDVAAPPVSERAAARPKRKSPARGRDNAFFWEGVDVGELRIQRCSGCGTLHHPPRPMCHHCQSVEWDWIVSSGRGTVHSFVVYHRPEVAPFDAPYVVGLIELEEGTRLVSNVVGIPPDEVRIDMPVECHFDEVEEGLILPQFYPAGSSARDGAQ